MNALNAKLPQEVDLCKMMKTLSLNETLKQENKNTLKILNITNLPTKIMNNVNTQKLLELEKTVREIPNVVKTPHDSEILLKVKIFEYEKVALFDTGAEICVLGQGSEDIVDRMKDIPIHKKINVKTGGGELHAGIVKKLPVEYDNEIHKIQFVYSQTIAVPIALGMNFYNAWKFKVVREIKSPTFSVIKDSDKKEEELNEEEEAKTSIEDEHELTKYEKYLVDKAMSKFNFSDGSKLGCQNIIQHKIDTGDSQPVYCLPYRYNPIVTSKIQDIIDRWLEQGVIEKSRSEWRLPIVVVTKPDKSLRLCLDARKLNSITKKDCHTPPNVLHKIDELPHEAQYFVRLDLNEAFLQTKVTPEDRKKTAFSIPNIGEFQFVRMPFGLINSPATQSRLMDIIFQEAQTPYIIHYLDDVIVMGTTIQHLIINIKIVADLLNKYGLTVSRKKTSNVLKRIRILGHIVDSNGIHTDPNKIKILQNWARPTTGKELQQFLGFSNWYRRFIKDYAIIAAPLYAICKKKILNENIWNDECDKSFENIKNLMCQSPVLRTPNWSLGMTIQADACDNGIGAILTQEDKEGEYVIEFYSYKLSVSEQKYSPTEKEMLAVIKAVRHFRYYIEFNNLTILTDHHALQYLLSMKVMNGRLTRWILELQPFVNCIKHRSGKEMIVADALSRAKTNTEIRLVNENDKTWYDDFLEELLENPDNYPQYYVEGNKIFRKIPWKRNELEDDYKRLPHPSEIPAIITEAHLKTHHAGESSTFYELKKLFWWPKMKEDIKNSLQTCERCLAIKHPNYKLTAPMGRFRIPKDTMHTLSIDIKGTLPVACRQKYRNIITVVDILSRYAWARRVAKVNTRKIIEFLQDIFREQNKIPKSIYHDNGTVFTSREFKAYLHDQNIKSYPTPIYHPQANTVERFNRSLTEALRIEISSDVQNQQRWATNLKAIIWKLNARMNHVTQYSPYEVQYGRTPDLTSHNQPAADDQRHNAIKQTAYKRSILRYLQNKRQFNERALHRDFQIGEIVMIRTFNLSNADKNQSGKLYPPYEVAKIVGRNEYVYTVLKSDGKIQRMNLKHLKGISKSLQDKLSYLFDDYPIDLSPSNAHSL